jgi:NAD(P)H-flavin reductase
MKFNTGTILEIQQSGKNQRTAVIGLSRLQHITAGQYFQAHQPGRSLEPVGINLFPGGFHTPSREEQTLITAPPISPDWQPGDTLNLHGPLGKGFHMPLNAARIALITLGETSDHLLPLARSALENNGEVALFTDGHFPKLPANIEVNPLTELQEASSWADYVALSGTWEEVQTARQTTALKNIRTTAEILVLLPMPCSGLASCGICAIPDRKGNHRLVCEEGPVFNWREL